MSNRRKNAQKESRTDAKAVGSERHWGGIDVDGGSSEKKGGDG